MLLAVSRESQLHIKDTIAMAPLRESSLRGLAFICAVALGARSALSCLSHSGCARTAAPELTTTAVVYTSGATGAQAATTEADLNQWLVAAEYAVRGEIIDVAEALEKRLAAGEKFPFDELVKCNIGNPQALGQKPLSFNRQVSSLRPLLLPHRAASGRRERVGKRVTA